MNNDKFIDGPATTPLASAQEKALSKVPAPDAAPDTTAVFAAIRGGKAASFKPVHGITDQTIDVFAFLVELDVAEPELLTRLRNLNDRMVAIHDRVAEFAPGKVNAFLFKARDEIHAAVQAGQEPEEAPTREAVQQHFTVCRTGLLNQLNQLTWGPGGSVELCRPLLDKFASALEASMRDMEAEQKELCTAYGLPFEPAYLWRVAATVAARTSLRLPAQNDWRTPAQLLENLVEL